MTAFFHLYVGKLGNTPFEVIQEMVHEKFLPKTLMTYTINEYPNNEVVFIAASFSPLEVGLVKQMNQLLSTRLDFVYEVSDIYETEVSERYLVCFDTKTLLQGRNSTNDQLMDAVWDGIQTVDVDCVSCFSQGYLVLVFSSKNPLRLEIREKIKTIVERFYPDSFIFEHPILP